MKNRNCENDGVNCYDLTITLYIYIFVCIISGEYFTNNELKINKVKIYIGICIY